MKCSLLLAALAAPMLASGYTLVNSRKVATKDNPIPKVLTLLEDLKAKIEADAESEQAEYDKYACWCEDTLGQKAQDISDAKEHIEELQELVVKLSGELGVHKAEIQQLEKDIAQNIESTREATEVREKGVKEYEEEKAESEQCIGALEAAIKVLTGAGETKKEFLQTLHEAQLLSVAADVRAVLKSPEVPRSMTEKQLQIVQAFTDKPEDFVRGRSGNFMSAAQIANNPYGDYAPQSTQIQGILKEMYTNFAKDLEKSNTEEAEKQKAYEELMATKKKELETLEATLEKQKADDAAKTKELADSEKDIDDTKAQLKADEEFFASTKVSCSDKAAMWSSRTRLRTEELHGINQAVEILSSDEATKTFENATSTFLLQLGSRSRSRSVQDGVREKAYTKLSALATKFQNVEIARFAVQAKTAGHFDAVISAIDQMIARLREQEQNDIKERDWCNDKLYQNKITIEDLEHDIEMAEKGMSRLEDEIAELKVEHLKEELNETKEEVEELKALRADERAKFIQSIKDDDDAIALLDKAIAALSKYYSFAQAAAKKDEPPPETSFDTGDYTGKEEATKGVVSILAMIKEDLQKEMLTARNGDAQAQVQYESDLSGLNKVISALAAKIAEILSIKAAKEEELANLEEHKAMKETDLEAEEKVKKTLEEKCAWVESHFESRRDSRKAEIQGLIEAKAFLAGVE
jgi:DNA repair exonuclease SbcCD ATPase subunit